ncbi:putative TetR family transcriptional regulator [Gordonia namibiensis NBRC 108229]|uniref:Putative TetR family transcriptional regulator n=1 Tax=Gordonia namibiensis NBRC 108229 TaxID=1208314 RepID=K6WJY9_9ACTN|nr:TetR/AcrR family transcriptional regulator [Gordonia namibiensis]GAB99690.1 putative TetR family transcriptional regulator [Gordonia namibiensis NBRC 108229]
MNDPKPVHLLSEASATKRRAVVEAARDLFVSQGVDRVSMDAVAAKAKVSKATVYGYFGDKQRLFRSILADATESLDIFANKVIDAHLGDDAGITTVARLEQALTSTAIDLGVTVVGSMEYAAVLALVAQRRWQDPDADDDLETGAVENAISERIAHFAGLGLLSVEDPRRAADHFFALTLLLAFNEQPNPLTVDSERLRRTMIDGAHAFVRAYGVG